MMYPRLIAEASVTLITRSLPYGAGRDFEVEAEVWDHGPDWHMEGAEARYSYETAGYIAHFGRGGAVLNRDPDGDPVIQWTDTPVATTALELERFVRDEWWEFGRNPFVEDQDSPGD